MLNRYKNLSIKGKLVCGFGLSGVLLALIGCMAFVGMNRLSSHSEFIYKINVVPLTVLGDLRAEMLSRRNAVMWHLLGHDAVSMDAQEKKIVELDQTIEALTAKYEPVIATESERKLYEQLKGGVPAYKDVRKKVLDLSRNFRKESAAEVQQGELMEKLGVLTGAVDGLVKENEQQAQASYAESHSLSTVLNWTMMALMLAAFLIGVWTVWFVSKSIVGNVENVLHAAEQLKGGNLAARATVTAQDETGKLAAAFNQMAETVEGTSKLQEDACRAQQSQAVELGGIMKAIKASQAAIEFNPDGTVITANENFLKTVGYRLDEIKGQHHRIFCDSAYVNSREYADFWQKLNRGEFEAGCYRRLGSAGKEVWIQASYNPIVNAQGQVTKVIKFASDITAQKQAQVQLEQCMNEAQSSLGALAQGDLTQLVQGTYEGELAAIKASTNAALANLSQIIGTVREAVTSVAEGSDEISKGNEDLAQRTTEQASALQETAASMEEMTSTVKHNPDNAKQANVLAIAAWDAAAKGGTITKRAVEAMGGITKSSKKIADIITVVDGIAFQTNLLALNAAVEAARAGEHERGFAVVAAEVRNLAQRSASAAKEIEDLIGESLQAVTDGSGLVTESGKTLEEVVTSVKRVADIIGEISAASQEQASGIEQINQALLSMDDMTQQNAALVEETTSAAQSMNQQARELSRQVEVFRVTGTGSATPRAVPVPVRRAVPVSAGGRAGQTPRVEAKKDGSPQPAGVGAWTGRDRRHRDETFDEF